MTSHQERIREQFTSQAVPFSKAASIADGQAIQLLIDLAQAGPGHRSLDVACGPGLVALAFAKVVASAVGVDATPAMLDRARTLQERQSRGNVEWVDGDACKLPFPDASFDIVTCRFAFHHLLEPAEALKEMKRVTRPGGRIVVCDGIATDDPQKAAAFNAFEQLRDPSTVRFLTAQELRGLFAEAGLAVAEERRYGVAAELEGLLRISFPGPENLETLRAMMRTSLADDGLGLSARAEGERIHFAYPSLILAAVK